MAERKTAKHRALRTTAVGLLAFLVLFSIGSLIFIKAVYDKHFPRVDEPEYSGYLRYDDVNGYDRTVAHLQSGKNTLAGYLYGAENDKGLVVISHGLGFGAEDYLAEALYFVDKGWTVFAFDNTGTYASEGKNTVGLSQSLIDLRAALAYIESDDALNDLPMMLYGHSWGAYAVTAVLNYDDSITAVTSMSGFNSPMGLLDEQMQSMVGPLAYVEHPLGWVYQTMLLGSTVRITAVDGINRSGIPVMIIHGDHDRDILYDGASIIAHRDEITNPNVIYKTCSAENHNSHNDLWVSEAATQYINAINQEYKQLYDSYDGNIPDDVRARYYEGVDKFRTSELDADFMDEINRFFEGSLSN